MKSVGVCYWCVKIPQCGYMEHGLKDIAFYVQKHISLCTVVITSLLVRDKPPGAPASVKRVYCNVGEMPLKLFYQHGIKEHKQWKCVEIIFFWPSFQQLYVNIGSGNGLVPDGTKPLPEPMLTNIFEATLRQQGLTHWRLNNTVETLYYDISKAFWQKILSFDFFRFRFYWNLSLWIQMTKSQQWSGKDLSKCWSRFIEDIMVSLLVDLNELIHRHWCLLTKTAKICLEFSLLVYQKHLT